MPESVLMVPEPSRPGDQTVAGCSVSGATDHMGRNLHLQNQAPTAAGSATVRGKYTEPGRAQAEHRRWGRAAGPRRPAGPSPAVTVGGRQSAEVSGPDSRSDGCGPAPLRRTEPEHTAARPGRPGRAPGRAKIVPGRHLR